MNNEPVAWMNRLGRLEYEQGNGFEIPLYTHQYERPHNTVLVPCNKLAEMQAEIEHLKGLIVQLKMQVNGLKKASEK